MIETERLSIGQISSGFGRSGNRRAGSLRGWFVDHAEVRRTISAGHDVYKCQWIVSHWSVDDPADGASESPSELAPVSGGGVSRWIHNIFQFRVRDFPIGARRRPLDGYVLSDRQRGVGLSRCVDGRSFDSPPIKEAKC